MKLPWLILQWLHHVQKLCAYAQKVKISSEAQMPTAATLAIVKIFAQKLCAHARKVKISFQSKIPTAAMFVFVKMLAQKLCAHAQKVKISSQSQMLTAATPVIVKMLQRLEITLAEQQWKNAKLHTKPP